MANETNWKKFVVNPSNTSHRMLLRELKKCKNATTCKELAPSSEIVGRLVKLIADKDLRAVDVAFLSRSLCLLDGGDLEDVNRALGQLSETDPKLLLTHLRKYKVSGRSFENTLIILPIETVDDLDAQVRTVQKRIDSISSVNDASLVLEKDNAIHVLMNQLGDLQKLIKEKR
jgi:hypothetical protein